jgi:uncharacterized protein YjbI with pentapeptide repeats
MVLAFRGRTYGAAIWNGFLCGGPILRRLVFHSEASTARLGLDGHFLMGLTSKGLSLKEPTSRGLNFRERAFKELNFSVLICGAANLANANLTGANLTKALADSKTQWPRGFKLKDAGVYVLEPRADLQKADLAQRNLSGADLSGAQLQGADLSWADLRAANLANANLTEVDLREANLTAVSLSSVRLNKADLSGAFVDSNTKWPPGFSSETAGTRDAASNRLQRDISVPPST